MSVSNLRDRGVLLAVIKIFGRSIQCFSIMNLSMGDGVGVDIDLNPD